MNTHFTYSVLQYRHSIASAELLNVAILFYFQESDQFEFSVGNIHRIKTVYPDLNFSLFNAYVKAIKTKSNTHVNAFSSNANKSDFAKYVHQYILPEDAAGFVFDTPKQVKNVFASPAEAIDSYAKLLLPDFNPGKSGATKHNESYILKTFTTSLFLGHSYLEEKFTKNVVVHTKNLKLNFDLSWQNGTHNLIKPISFDLQDELSIQAKAATFVGYLTQLESYAQTNNVRFDFLISKPQSTKFTNSYENAIELLNWNHNPFKQIITEEKWDDYSSKTLKALLPKI